MKHDARHIILATLLAILTAACSDAPLPGAGNPADSRLTPLSFTIPSATLTPASRTLNYDGTQTTFSEGTLIGCVIAYKNADAEGGYEYRANSCWTWHPEGLKLTKLFDSDNNTIDIDGEANTIIRHFTADELTSDELADHSRAPYFLRLLDPDAEYAFFFYYPYVDEAILTQAYESAPISYPNSSESNDWGITGNTILEKINNHSLVSPVSAEESDGNNNTAAKTASWTAYPIGCMIDLSQEEANERLHHSDFMYARANETTEGEPISVTTAKSMIPVTLQKKMVTMDLYVLTDVDETSLKLVPGTVNNNPVMKRLKRFNLMTGEFGVDFNYKGQWDGSLLEKNSRYYYEQYQNNYPIVPCKIGTATETINGEATTYNVFRVILPPQNASEFRCSLSFKVKDSDKTLTLNNMNQNSGIKSLQSGCYYKLRFTKINEQYGFHLEIADWEKGNEISINRPD